jgi:FkbM family methyltransferase
MGAQRVVSFEPIPELAADLLKLSKRRRNLRVHCAALSDAPGRTTFMVNRERPGESGLRSHWPKDEFAITVDVFMLDHFDLEGVDFIKVDTEGCDLNVLAGGVRTIGRSRPLISVEFGLPGYKSFGHTKTSLLGWANKYQYAVCDLFGNHLSDDSYDKCVDSYYWDFFLLPAERTELAAQVASSGLNLFNNIDSYIVA